MFSLKARSQIPLTARAFGDRNHQGLKFGCGPVLPYNLRQRIDITSLWMCFTLQVSQCRFFQFVC